MILTILINLCKHKGPEKLSRLCLVVYLTQIISVKWINKVQCVLKFPVTLKFPHRHLPTFFLISQQIRERERKN